MKSILRFGRRLAIIVGVLFFIVQFIRPERTNPPVHYGQTFQERFQPPQRISNILHRACMDCHSNETKWPWYSEVAPVSWFVSNDVVQGRRRLNFSNWSGYGNGESQYKLKEIQEWVEKRMMPLSSYVTFHPEAMLSDQDINELAEWINQHRKSLAENQ